MLTIYDNDIYYYVIQNMYHITFLKKSKYGYPDHLIYIKMVKYRPHTKEQQLHG